MLESKLSAILRQAQVILTRHQLGELTAPGVLKLLVPLLAGPTAPMPVPQGLHDSEIAGQIAWHFDGAFHMRIGEGLGGPSAESTAGSLAEAEARLAKLATELYPDSAFARRERS